MTNLVKAPEHSRLSPSGSKLWMNCPGSIRMQEPFENVNSPAAIEGTAAHALGEWILQTAGFKSIQPQEKYPKFYDTELRKFGNAGDVEVTRDMVSFVHEYTDYVLGLDADEMYIEQHVDLKYLHPDIWGRGDFMGINVEDWALHVVDLKYGRNVVVEAGDNSQLRIYGLASAAKLWKRISQLASEHGKKPFALKVSTTIVQPRAHHDEGSIRTETLRLDELMFWGWSCLRPAAIATDDPEAPCVAGEHCKEGFCRAMTVCEAFKKRSEALILQDFNLLSEREIESMSPERISQMLQFWEMVGGLDELKKKTYSAALVLMSRGLEIPGYKAVAKRANRAFKDPSEAEALLVTQLGKRAYRSKLVSPAQAEDELKAVGHPSKDAKAFITDLVYVPNNGLTVASVNDKRPAMPLDEGASLFFED